MTDHEHKPGPPGPDKVESGLKYETKIINDDWELVMVPGGDWRRTEWAAEVLEKSRSGEPKTKKDWSTVSVGPEAEARPHLVPRTEMAQKFVSLMGSEDLAAFSMGIPTGHFEDPESGEQKTAIRFRATSFEKLEGPVNDLVERFEEYKSGEKKRLIAEVVVEALPPAVREARTRAVIVDAIRADAQDVIERVGIRSQKVIKRLDQLVEIFTAFLSIKTRKEEFNPFHSTTEFWHLEGKLTRRGITETQMLAEIDLVIAKCAEVLEEWREYEREHNADGLN